MVIWGQSYQGSERTSCHYFVRGSAQANVKKRLASVALGFLGRHSYASAHLLVAALALPLIFSTSWQEMLQRSCVLGRALAGRVQD